MQIEHFDISGPLLIRPRRFEDRRGWFSESWSRRALADVGLDVDFVQDNVSVSFAAGVLRGLHCQVPPFAQGKLIQVFTGALRDVAVDVREGSPTFGHHLICDLSEDDPAQIWIPPGFIHGFVTMRANTRVMYKASAFYSREHERAVAWNDPDLAIDWGVRAPILSSKDAAAARLKDQPGLFPVGAFND